MLEAIAEFLKSWSDLLTASVALIGMGAFVYRYVFSALAKLSGLPELVNGLQAQVREIHNEMHPKDENTLKQSFDKLKVDIDKMSKDVLFMTARQWAILNTADQPTFETDSEGRLVRANKAYLDLVERQIDELKGNGWKIIIHPSDREVVTKEWDTAIREQRNFESEFRIVTPSGRTYAVECIAVPIYFSGMLVFGFLGRYDSFKEH